MTYELRVSIEYSDAMHALARGIVHEIINHGGLIEDLRLFNSDKELLRKQSVKFVRQYFGGIWEIVDKDFPLGPIDYRCSLGTYVGLFDWLSGFPGSSAESKPAERICNYRLHHFGREFNPEDVLKAELPANSEFADARELLMFVHQHVSHKLLKNDVVLIAPGTHAINDGMHSFPILYSDKPWKMRLAFSYANTKQTVLRRDALYLLRIYE